MSQLGQKQSQLYPTPYNDLDDPTSPKNPHYGHLIDNQNSVQDDLHYPQIPQQHHQQQQQQVTRESIYAYNQPINPFYSTPGT